MARRWVFLNRATIVPDAFLGANRHHGPAFLASDAFQ